MRKRNEGYALPLVLVVMVVLSLVAVSIMSVSLRNMQNQRSSIEQMQDQYTAEGAIEAVLAKLDHTTAFTVEADSNVLDTLTQKLNDYCDSVREDGQCTVSVMGVPSWADEGAAGTFTYAFSLTAVSGTTQVTCDMELAGKLTSNSVDYLLSDSTITYNAYTVSTAAEGGGA